MQRLSKKPNDYHMINVWATMEQRENHVKRLLLGNRNFKLATLESNPLYKPVFERLDALAMKELTALDNSILWSRHYTKSTFKYTFAYPLLVFTVLIFLALVYGVKYRIYMNYLKKERVLQIVEKMDIDLEDVESYPKAVFELYLEKKKYDSHIKRKEERMTQIEQRYHDISEKRIVESVAEKRRKRGLRVLE